MTNSDLQQIKSGLMWIVGPFTILGHATIVAGYTVSYEMLLRNLSLDCHCRADVRVIAARPLLEPEYSSPSR